MPESFGESRSAGVERSVMLTDAVVAIAMTLLVLPLVEAVPDVDLNDVGAFASENVSLFISFAVSFFVILLFWTTHRTIFAAITTMTPGLRILNALWLLGVAFLPFPTALIGKGPTTSTTPLYIGSILALSLLTTAMFVVSARSAASWDLAVSLRRHAVVAAVGSLVLVAATYLATRLPDAALIALVILAPLRIAGGSWANRPTAMASRSA